jgi:hypothetical protein
MKKTIITLTIFLSIALAAYAMDSSKPDDHNTSWNVLHGKRAGADPNECYSCHVEKAECITCHEDTQPRSHTLTWSNKTHGLQARWSRDSCKTCHTEDSCISCHDSTEPKSHDVPSYRNAHCNIGCQRPVNTWKNTPSKDCVTCHRKKPIPTHDDPL